jgi:glycosyltransferase involved in cell wall biosynthesis
MTETALIETAPAVAAPDPSAPCLPGLSIVLPCFNEEANVADAIRAAMAAAKATAEAYEVVVVNDGSTDATAEIASAFAAEDEHVRLIVHAANRGYGDALRSGLRAARILLTDADLQFDLGELEEFLPFAGQADLVVGCRRHRSDPIGRRVNASLWNLLVRRLFHVPIRDVDCAFKLVRADALDGIALTSHGAMISTELIVKALAGGARLRELDVHHHPRVAGEQSGASPRVVLRAFQELLKLRGELRGLSLRAP